MIRTTNILEGKAEGQELNKKLTRNVSECVRKVDEFTAAARSAASFFNPEIISARLKLRDACEKAIKILKSNSLKFEDVLWRKVYYEPFSHAKKLRKGSSWHSTETGVVWMHLDDGIAFYQHLIITLNENSENGINTDLLPSNFGVDVKIENGSGYTKDSIFRCLTYLGDLSRYLLDIPSYASLETSYLVSVRHYHQALHCNREAGLTHSNLATVYSTSKQPLLATLHFLRAMTCMKPFEAAEVSLKLMLDKMKSPPDKNSFIHIKDAKQTEKDSAKFLHSCLLLVSHFLVHKNSEDSSNICQDVLVQLGKLLDNYDNDPFEVCDASIPKSFNFELEPESMVVLCTVFIICTKRLENTGSAQCNMSEVLIVSILLTVLTHINTRLEQRFSLVDPTFIRKLLPKIEKGEESHSQTSSGSNNTASKEDSQKTSKKYSNLRRRRRKKPVRQSNGINGCIDRDHSSDSASEKELSSPETDDDTDSISLPSSEDDLDDDNDDVIIESDQEWEGLTASEHFELVSQEGMMAAVFIMLSWLCVNEHLLKSCSVSAKSLWESLAKFFNLINIDYKDLLTAHRISSQKELIGLLKSEEEIILSSAALSSYYLPEEVMLHLVLPMIKQQVKRSEQDLNSTTLYRLIRLKLIKCQLLTKKHVPIKLENGFLVVTKPPAKTEPRKPTDEIKSSSPKRNISSPSSMRVTSSMQALTAQWLQHEVKNLEEKTKGGGTLGGLYLVPDVNVMVQNLAAVKKIVVSGTHMVIIPQTVIDELDRQKKESSGAREAIRWLELKLSRGSRFVRVQRAHEKTKLPLIKYPKRKDKDAWQWFHLAECCYYLGAQMGYVNKKKRSTVTLLTGENGVKTAKRSFPHHTLAETSGAVLMNVQDFMGKWHSSTKGQS